MVIPSQGAGHQSPHSRAERPLHNRHCYENEPHAPTPSFPRRREPIPGPCHRSCGNGESRAYFHPLMWPSQGHGSPWPLSSVPAIGILPDPIPPLSGTERCESTFRLKPIFDRLPGRAHFLRYSIRFKASVQLFPLGFCYFQRLLFSLNTGPDFLNKLNEQAECVRQDSILRCSVDPTIESSLNLPCPISTSSLSCNSRQSTSGPTS